MGQKAAVRDLKSDPAWAPADLGFPLPDSPHACLVSLPTWDAVIGYEEGRADVVQAMRAGYPRFFVHPTTWALFEELERRLARPGERVVAYSTPAAAARARDYAEARSGHVGRLEEVDGLSVLVVPQAAYQAARDYWRHTGELVTSRQAEDFLAGRRADRSGEVTVRADMARVMEVREEDLFLFESGMAAIFTLFRVVTARGAGRKTLQLCFPYVDALKIQEQFGAGVDFVASGRGERFRSAVGRIRAGEYAAVFCEIPSNPLLHTVDFPAVAEACCESQTPLLVDDTICSHYNVDVLSGADAVSTSLTKWVSGIGDVMAGSIKLNEGSALAGEFRRALEKEAPGGLRMYPRDAEVLVRNAQGFVARVTGANRGGEIIAEHLAFHPAVDRVWYPKLVDRAEYDALRTPDGGYGGLMSFTLKDPGRAPAVYEAMRLSKGPSLGTEYTLVCPYTQLAHYTELDWAEECGVPRNLLRLSVGLESVDDLLGRIDAALVMA